MADATIGALRVLLGLDTAAFTSGTQEAKSALSDFAKQTTTIAAGIGLEKFVEQAANSFAHLIKASIETADEIGKMSQKIGVPVENLSALTVAATVSNVSLEQFAKGVARLDKELVAAAAGGTSAAASALQFLGISIKQLQNTSPEKVLGLVADGIKKLDDGATKTAVSVAIFGQRFGKDLIPLLNLGSQGFEEMARTAAALGLVISTQTAKAAEKFVDNSKLLGLSIQGIGNVIAAFFLPGMAKSSDAMLKWVVDGNIVAKTAEVIVRAILFMGDNFLIFATLLGGIFAAPIISAIASMGLAFVSLGTSILVAAAASAVMAVRMLVATAGIALVGGAVLALTGYLDDFLKKVEELSSNKLPSAKDVFDGFNAVLGAVGLNTQSLTKDLKDLGKDGAASAKAVSDALKGLKFDPNSAADAKKFNDELLKLGLKARELKGDFDGLAPGFVQAAVQFKLIKDTGDGFVGTVDTLNPKMLQLNNALLNVAAGQLTKDSLTPWDEYTKKVDLVNRALQLNIETSGKAGISAAVAADQSNKAWSKVVTTLGTALADAAGNFATFFNQFAQGNKEMFIIGKAFSISQALINSYVAFTKALASLPPPFNYVAAAAVLAAGIAMVAKIIAEKPPGAAKGGSFMVPGGSMSVDTKLVPMALAPGERVDVTPAGQAGRTASGVLVVNPIRPKDFFTGDTVREMVLSIDQWMRDGGSGVRFARG